MIAGRGPSQWLRQDKRLGHCLLLNLIRQKVDPGVMLQLLLLVDLDGPVWLSWKLWLLNDPSAVQIAIQL